MKRILLLAAALAITMISACYYTVNTVSNQDPNMERTFVSNKQVLTDRHFAKMFEIRRIDSDAGETTGGLMQVQATIANVTGKPHRLAYMFVWFDEHGMVVETPASTWVQINFAGGETKYIRQTAPNQRCKDFNLKFQLND